MQQQPERHNWSTERSAERTRFHRQLFLEGRLAEMCDAIRASRGPIPSLVLEELGFAIDEPDEPDE